MRTALWFVVLGALLMAFGITCGAMGATPTDAPVEPGWTSVSVKFRAYEASTGRPVPRDEWVSKAAFMGLGYER